MEPVKHLTITQLRNLRKLESEASDHLAIAWSCDVPVEQAREWFETAPAGDVVRCLERIFELSKMTGAAQFPGEAADDVGNARPGVDD